jgi:putative CRISPR-associated protein (TIGR02619 family)
MRHTLICTVGTSLLGSLGGLPKNLDEYDSWLGRQPKNDRNHLDFDIVQTISDEYQKSNLQVIAKILNDFPSSLRICGAEINSITSIINKNLLDNKKSLIFLVSETDGGKAIGQLLRLYYENSQNPISFAQVEIRELKGLRDDNVSAFQKEGLKNLVKEISQEARKFDPSSIAINATGGYKAQISFAGMIGQALGIPVYYLFEKFSEIIELPPQPISLDLGFWLNNYTDFSLLEAENTIKKSELEFDWQDSKLDSLLDQEQIDQDILISLSAMGILFHEQARLQFARQSSAMLSIISKDNTSPEDKPISLRDDHGKDILMAFAKKIRRSPYVKAIINSLPFNPRRSDPIRRTYPDGKVEFILTWTDPGLGICIQTTGQNLAETNTIALYLQSKFAT